MIILCITHFTKICQDTRKGKKTHIIILKIFKDNVTHLLDIDKIARLNFVAIFVK
jgi:hypothetical protein